MHPVKAEEAIAEAYFQHGVRTFSLDTLEELDKIVGATATDGVAATDLNLLVRLRVSSDHAKLSLAAKFGAEPGEVKPLLFAARQAADALGICFHVGSQAMSPAAYAEAMGRVRDAIVEAAVTVDIVDVGGGFPSSYPGMEPPPLETYFAVIHEAFESAADQLFGRAVVRAGPRACAPNMRSLIVRVEKRRGERAVHQRRRLWRAVRCRAHRLALSGAAAARAGIARPADGVQLLRADLRRPRPYGRAVRASRPTSSRAIISRSACSAPMAARCGPRFNGFGADSAEIVEDEPMASLYGAAAEPQALERGDALERRLPLRRKDMRRVRLSPPERQRHAFDPGSARLRPGTIGVWK